MTNKLTAEQKRLVRELLEDYLYFDMTETLEPSESGSYRDRIIEIKKELGLDEEA